MIGIWNAQTGEALAMLQGHAASVSSVAVSPDGNRIVSCSDSDRTIRVWDVAMLQGHAAAVSSVAVSPDGNRIVSCSDSDRTIRVWDTDTDMAVAAPFQGHTSTFRSVAISADGNRIVSGSDDNTVRVLDAHTGKALLAPFQGHTGTVYCVAISMDDKLIVSGSSDMTVRMWDAMTSEPLGSPLRGHTDIVRHIAISPDGTRIVSGSLDEIRVWDVVTREKFREPLKVYDSHILTVKFSPDGQRIVSASSDDVMVDMDGWIDVPVVTIHVWDAVTGQTLRPPLCPPLGTVHELNTKQVYSAEISLDGEYIFFKNTETIWICDAENNSVRGTFRLEDSDRDRLPFWNAWSAAISPDGRHFICSDRERIWIWSMENGKAPCAPHRYLPGHTSGVSSIAISLDGKHIVSHSNEGTIRVWDLESLTRSKFLEAPAILFSSNPTHTLCSASSFLQDLHSSGSLIPNKEGWIIGPNGRLLLWIPAPLYPVVHGPCNTLVIPANGLQLDLSHFAHGRSWHKCREQEAGLSSALSLV
jgi:WD40 repeat protein